MRIKLTTIFYLLFAAISVFAQDLSNEYKVISINKKVNEIPYENPYQSPLENYIARMYLWIDGKNDTIHSETIKARMGQSAKPYPQKDAEIALNSDIEQIIIYRDSIGLIFRKENSNSGSYLVGMSQWENGKWLGIGEDICFAKNINEAKQYIETKAIGILNRLRRFEQLKIVSTDTIAFIDYLKTNSREPVRYLLDKLKNTRLVIYGEVHFRKNSWGLLRELMKTPEFSETTGRVFFELSACAQPAFDRFYNNETKDVNIILDIFRKEEITGWPDKNMYDCLVDLWDINQKLPDEKKIKVIATEYQRTFYHEITSKQQYDSIESRRLDRDEIMAECIENHISKSNDKRNNLFIVGRSHAYKSPALTRGGLQINGLSAGYILSEKLGKENVFSIFTHSASTTNEGHLHGKFRNGLFDFVFAETGNKPIAFDLVDSPFGNEPFDGSAEIWFDIKAGTYANNYDGYIFLQPIQEELNNYLFPELYSDEYIDEIKRRAKIIGTETNIYFGIELRNLNRTELLDNMKKEDGEKRWKDL
ncbi:MAG: hypothetical protein LBI82_03930 [Dysgonamonadaceae bacterium]|jgi:hypothetical protein|nr:hypothetical protein [Dysgonamonadaceae bacterium]